jgi:hypothetical protein
MHPCTFTPLRLCAFTPLCLYAFVPLTLCQFTDYSLHILILLFHTHYQPELSPGSLKIMKLMMNFEIMIAINEISKKTDSDGVSN